MIEPPISVLQLICPTGFYGAERWIMALSKNLDSQMVKSCLAVTSDDVNSKFELLDQFQLLQKPTFRLEMLNRFDIGVIANVRKLITVRNIDIVHSHGYKSDLIAVLSVIGTKAKVISTPHGYTAVTSIKDRSYHLAGNWALRRCSAVVPLSDELRRQVIDRGVRSENITLIENGVDLSEIDPIAKSSTSVSDSVSQNKEVRIGYVGQLVPRKRVDLLIKTFENIHQQLPHAQLEVYGDGSSLTELKALAGSSNCSESITFHGWVRNRLEHMANLDLMLMTSSAEGIPRTLMEAMAIGTPCCAFDIDGVSDLIEDGVSGQTAPFGDVELLAEKCLGILNSQAFASSIKIAARERIESRFSAKRVAEEYQALYAELVG